MKCQPLKDSRSNQPPPPQFNSGDDPNIIGGFVGNGSVKNNKLLILFLVATQTLLPMIFLKFIWVRKDYISYMINYYENYQVSHVLCASSKRVKLVFN